MTGNPSATTIPRTREISGRRAVVCLGALVTALLVLANVVTAISASWGQYSFSPAPLSIGKYSAYTKFPVAASAGSPYYSWIWDQTSPSGKVVRYDGSSNSWVNIFPTQSEGFPTPREGACWAQTMENALHQQRLLLYGGKRSDDQMLTQEWNVFNLATSNWELKRTTPAPTTPRWYVGCDTVLVNFDCSPNCLKAV